MHRGTKVALSILALLIPAVMAFPIPVAATADPLVITTDTILTGPHAGSIVIGANGITLNCAGHTVSGSSAGVGILLASRTGVIVKNCVVTGFLFGFLLSSSSGNILAKNTASGNGASGFTLTTSSNDNILTQNAASGNGGPLFGSGIAVFSSTGNILVKNAVSGSGAGIVLSLSSSHNILSKNTVTGSGVGIVLTLVANNILTHNVANDNTFIGVSFQGASNNILKKNTADGNGFLGFALRTVDSTGSSNNILLRNAGCDNGLFDALQDASSIGNIFIANKFCTTDGI